MKKSQTAFDKIKMCIQDVEDFKDLIQINDTEIELVNRYSLLQTISGEKIKNRIENLIIACWSAKDYLKKEIIKEIGEGPAKVFENRIFQYEETELIQYLADSLKHGGIDDKYLTKNKFKIKEPKLDVLILNLSNQSVPGLMKPFFQLKGDDIGGFDIQMVKCEVNGEIHYNYDTILLTALIIDTKNVTIGNTTDLIFKYTNIINKIYNRMMRI